MSGIPAFVFDKEHIDGTTSNEAELAAVLQRNVVVPVMTTSPDRHMATKTNRRNTHKYQSGRGPLACLRINNNTDLAQLVLLHGGVTLPGKK